MSKCRFSWAVAAAMGLVSIVLLSRLLVTEVTDVEADGRTAVMVTPAAREQILAEMRGLLEAVQTIIVANNAGDLNSVVGAARKVGRSGLDRRAMEFAGTLPLEFRKLGMDTHSRFDQLALDAEKFENTGQVSQQLGALTGNCVACHRAYRLATDNSKQDR